MRLRHEGDHAAPVAVATVPDRSWCLGGRSPHRLRPSSSPFTHLSDLRLLTSDSWFLTSDFCPRLLSSENNFAFLKEPLFLARFITRKRAH